MQQVLFVKGFILSPRFVSGRSLNLESIFHTGRILTGSMRHCIPVKRRISCVCGISYAAIVVAQHVKKCPQSSPTNARPP